MMPKRANPAQSDLFAAASETPAARAQARRASAAKSEAAQQSTAGVGPASVAPAIAALAARLPPQIFLGTSSWYFPGWKDIVWDRAPDQKTLAREGLRAYAQHPLLRTVGIDRTYYAPLPAAEFARYAEQAPAHFRALIKAPSAITIPAPLAERRTTNSPIAAKGTSKPQPDHFLDAEYAVRRYIEPCQQGLGGLLFQFPPLRREFTREPAQFIRRLREFLKSLPLGPLYALELRNPEFFCADYAEALSASGARHCIGIHPRTPDLAQQLALVRGLPRGALVVRWNLNPNTGRAYDEAKELYAPFDRLVDEDAATRKEIARLCIAQANAGQAAFVIINNKAEGSAPLSVIKLAEAIAAG
jgi:uncharacterized protein YecE (DUF72 family)